MAALPVAENSGTTAPGRPFQPGQSGNPGGRPKGLAALVRAQTRDGAELVDFMLAIFRGKKKAPLRVRMEAVAWLADRGFGKVPQLMEHAGPDGTTLTVKVVYEDSPPTEHGTGDGDGR